MTETTYAPPLPPQDPPPRPRERTSTRLVALVLAAGLVGGGAGAAVTAALDDDPTPAQSTSAPANSSARSTASSLPTSSIARVAQTVQPSVVSIAVQGAGGPGVGTGVVLDADGHILTNNHVVAAAAGGGTILVRFSDGRTARATIVGRDPVSDLAVIKVSGVRELRPAQLGSSRALAVGDPVIAFGSPLGLSGTVTSGIVSALNRPVRTGGGDGGGGDRTSTVLDAIQTDAAINPGNSGGPLVNARGEVVGINSAIATLGGPGGASGSIGLGFAIPIDQAKPIAEELIRTGRASHAWLGVQVGDQGGSLGGGALLAAVSPGGPAAKAGLREGDVVTAVDDRPIADADGLIAATRSHRPGDEVRLQVQRGGDTRTVRVTLGTAPF